MYPDNIVPGPGSYTDGTKLIGVNARKTSLKERKFYLDDDEMAQKIGGPGPGTYMDQQALHKEGHYASSEMYNSKAAKMNTGRRFRDWANGKPGPGTYEETGQVSSGKQVCTNFHSTRVKNMSTTEPRTQWGGNPRFRTPAPGTYRPPSDFGYLEFKSQLRDNLNGSIMTGFDTSMANTRPYDFGKLDHSTSKRSTQRNNS